MEGEGDGNEGAETGWSWEEGKHGGPRRHADSGTAECVQNAVPSHCRLLPLIHSLHDCGQVRADSIAMKIIINCFQKYRLKKSF